MKNRIKQLFEQSIEIKIAIADSMQGLLVKAAQRLVTCLLNDGKILICGNGGSAANALHFSVAMMNRFELERPSLPVIALTNDIATITAIGNENHYVEIFAKQIQAIGRDNDILLALSTSGNTDSILQAVNAANDHNIDTILLSGRDGGLLATRLGPEDIEIRIPSDNAGRIREMHLFILHCFCDLIENSLFGQLLK